MGECVFFLLNIREPETLTIFFFFLKKNRPDPADLPALDAVNEAGGGSQSGRFTTKQTIQSIVAMQMQLCKDMQQEPFFITIRRFVKPEPAEATISVTCSNSEPMANQGSGNSMFFFSSNHSHQDFYFLLKRYLAIH